MKINFFILKSLFALCLLMVSCQNSKRDLYPEDLIGGFELLSAEKTGIDFNNGINIFIKIITGLKWRITNNINDSGENLIDNIEIITLIRKKSKNITITLSNISIYEYPSAKNQLRIVLFDQDYNSNLITNKTKKKQIWRNENGGWKIIYEGTK